MAANGAMPAVATEPGSVSMLGSVAAAVSARNTQLDVLRGVAILLVFGRHLEIPHPEGVVG